MYIKITIFKALLLIILFTGNATIKCANMDKDKTETEKQAKISDIKKLLEMTGASETWTEGMRLLAPQLQESAPDEPEAFWEAFWTEFSGDSVINLIAPVYTKYLSQEEIRALIKLYDTPAWKRWASVSPQIIQESELLIHAHAKEIIQRLLEKSRKEKIPKVEEIFHEEYLPTPDELVPLEKNPVPIKWTRPKYPQSAKKAGVEGMVWVKALVDKLGKVRDAECIDDPKEPSVNPDIFCEAAIEAAWHNEYKPAMRQGKPVPVWVSYKVEFSLKGKPKK